MKSKTQYYIFGHFSLIFALVLESYSASSPTHHCHRLGYTQWGSVLPSTSTVFQVCFSSAVTASHLGSGDIQEHSLIAIEGTFLSSNPSDGYSTCEAAAT